ncbi:MAG: alpha-L-arabinofuranosidase C-terminal domain-containing protein [Bacteroidales bacterium]|nr:alpha-L-arabinofuranosidase C-terminal domain-containing protein [Bacteroidales bacterium]
MKRGILLAMVCSLVIGGCKQSQPNRTQLVIATAAPVVAISPLLYGHFYEHIYHSANGGLWGDLVWNRSFEEFESKPIWTAGNGVVSQSEKLSDVKLIFGDPAWTDYEFTLEARKDSGYEGFLILFRAVDDHNFYWMNLGGWGNTQHCIEKEVGNSREVITPFVKGRIPEKEWILVKVAVSGNRIRVYLNNELIFNYTDDKQPILHGAVGIGSWSTAVSYRNLVVTGTNGNILYKGLPEVPENIAFPRHWKASDPLAWKAENKGALNGSHCITAIPNAQPVSVSQENFAVKQGNIITGSIWLKGTAGVHVSVQLKNGQTTVSESVVEKITGSWVEYPVVFSAQPASGNLQLCVTVSGKGSASIDQLSLMSDKSMKNDGFRPDLYEAVAAIKPTVIRWPGGCFAELYRWKSGIGPQHKRLAFPENIWDDKDVNSLGTDEFITLSRKLNSEPLLVINSGFHEGAGTPEAWAPWIQEACEWIEYCNGAATSTWGAVRAANGHPEPYAVKYWEIDNELWRSRVPDPHKYSQAVKLFAAAMRKTDPSITIIAHGGNGTDMEWNQMVLNECAADFDILSIHHYSDPDGYYSAALEQGSLYQKLRTAVAASANPAIRIYVSEWNAQSTDWRTGLYAGNLLNIFEQNSDIITMGGPALFLRHTTASAWDNAFINFDQQGWFAAPNYVVMKLWREHFAPQRLAMTGIPDSVSAVASHDPATNRLVIKMVNNSINDKQIQIKLPEGYPGTQLKGYLVKGASLHDRNTMENPAQIAPVDHLVLLKRHQITTTLPALSCLLITSQPTPAPR